jgi:hypothetical protein
MVVVPVTPVTLEAMVAGSSGRNVVAQSRMEQVSEGPYLKNTLKAKIASGACQVIEF